MHFQNFNRSNLKKNKKHVIDPYFAYMLAFKVIKCTQSITQQVMSSNEW